MEIKHEKACALDFGRDCVSVKEHDRVILAVPPWAVSEFLPDLTVPRGHCAIINAHYLLRNPVPQQFAHPIIGIIGGTAQWVFLRNDVASVTVSAAESLVRTDNEVLARNLWQDVAKALGLAAAPVPRCRIIKEKRATLRQSPDKRDPQTQDCYGCKERLSRWRLDSYGPASQH